MLQITPQMRILVAVEAVDGRKGIDSLVQLCREKLDTDPFSGCLFVFRSRSATSIRILTYDGQGFLAGTETAFQRAFRLVAEGRRGSTCDRGISGAVTACGRQSGHTGCADVAASELEHCKKGLRSKPVSVTLLLWHSSFATAVAR